MTYEFYDEYEEYLDYGTGGFQKNHKNKPGNTDHKAKKKHQSRSKPRENWEEIEVNFDFLKKPSHSQTTTFVNNRSKKDTTINGAIKEMENKTTNDSQKTLQQNKTNTPNGFTPGPNTHTIKGNIIDFDRVADIEKVENEHNGILTYGIKFLFIGKKGSSRIAWFNKNSKERDSVYNTEVVFWQSLKK